MCRMFIGHCAAGAPLTHLSGDRLFMRRTAGQQRPARLTLRNRGKITSRFASPFTLPSPQRGEGKKQGGVICPDPKCTPESVMGKVRGP